MNSIWTLNSVLWARAARRTPVLRGGGATVEMFRLRRTQGCRHGGRADRLIALNLGQSSELACSSGGRGTSQRAREEAFSGASREGKQREGVGTVCLLALYPGLRKARKRGGWRKGREDKAPYVHEGASCERCGVSPRGRLDAEAGGAEARAWDMIGPAFSAAPTAPVPAAASRRDRRKAAGRREGLASFRNESEEEETSP